MVTLSDLTVAPYRVYETTHILESDEPILFSILDWIECNSLFIPSGKFEYIRSDAAPGRGRGIKLSKTCCEKLRDVSNFEAVDRKTARRFTDKIIPHGEIAYWWDAGNKSSSDNCLVIQFIPGAPQKSDKHGLSRFLEGGKIISAAIESADPELKELGPEEFVQQAATLVDSEDENTFTPIPPILPVSTSKRFSNLIAEYGKQLDAIVKANSRKDYATAGKLYMLLEHLKQCEAISADLADTESKE